ncbi:F0F1 ATP synthase subunit delta [Paenibacillus chartarius]|uniref:ATP synthase subunit delta n=1 Tax=Paenibacillus chartarius TaxID=747481 RepID=A0ABV6DUR2_9BACL
MSSEYTVAKRYAKALFDLAQEQGIVSQVEEDLSAVITIIKENVELNQLLLHPNIESSAKTNMLKQLFEGRVSEAVLGTIILLVTRGREEVLPYVLADYVQIASEALNQATAYVTAPYELSDADKASVAEHFGKLSGKTIRVHTTIDKSLLGGIKVRIGDRLYDGSLSGKLNRLEKKLTETQAL